eukprot:COSAG04_NODE_5568_length_1566_cov_1.997273_2_plen_83_part_00
MNGLWVILPDGESFVVQEGPFVAFLDGSMTAEADPQVGKAFKRSVGLSVLWLCLGRAVFFRWSLAVFFTVTLLDVVEECPQL